jgi:hypothetical protein
MVPDSGATQTSIDLCILEIREVDEALQCLYCRLSLVSDTLARDCALEM